MSCKLITINGKPNSHKQKEFICNTEDEIALLPKSDTKGTFLDPNDTFGNEPCAIGSIALVCETSAVYMLAPNNEWIKI